MDCICRSNGKQQETYIEFVAWKSTKTLKLNKGIDIKLIPKKRGFEDIDCMELAEDCS
jgi:hypothetical protein